MKRSGITAVALSLVLVTGIAIMGKIKGSHAQSQTAGSVNGVAGQSIGVAGLFPLYDPTGNLIPNGRCVQAIVPSTATTGAWSMSYTALGFTTMTSFRADAISPTTSSTILANQYVAHVNSMTTTAINGVVTNNATATIATVNVTGLTFGASATSVSVAVCGS